MPESPLTYEQITRQLRETYRANARQRDEMALSPWKIEERGRFLELLQAEGKRSLLEIGAGPGLYGAFFREHGLDVICTDLSQEMVDLCREKGLAAYVLDFLSLARYFGAEAFDAVFAINCLLHVPNRELPRVLENIQTILRPGGLFYLGMYGGWEFEGVWDEDRLEPKRFFCFHTDDQLHQIVRFYFEPVFFKRIAIESSNADLHFQSFVLRRS